MHEYIINDIWVALRKSFGNFFGMIFLMLLWLAIVIFWFPSTELLTPDVYTMVLKISFFGSIIMAPIILVHSIFIYFANRRYVINLETGLITFPRSDIENTILEILLMCSYWNLARTKTIHASEVENLYLDTKRWSTTYKVSNGQTASGKPKYRNKTTKHVSYNMSLVGTFGSVSLDFVERQKRDEVRNAIQKCVKQHSDINIDRKVAEFN